MSSAALDSAALDSAALDSAALDSAAVPSAASFVSLPCFFLSCLCFLCFFFLRLRRLGFSRPSCSHLASTFRRAHRARNMHWIFSTAVIVSSVTPST